MVSGWKERRASGSFFIPLKFPAKSPRNLIIVLLVIFGLALLYLYAWIASYSILGILLVGLLGTLISKLLVLSGVAATYPIAYLKSERVIKKATQKVEGSDTQFIGITGSYGKTSVREYMYQVLGTRYKVAKNLGNFNAPDGVALSVLANLEEETEYFVTEMAAYHKGIIARSASIVKPKYGVITGLGNQHLDLFGSKLNLIEGKSELFVALPEDGVAYINIDCDGWEKAASYARCKVVTYSAISAQADLRIEPWLLEIGEENNIANLVNLLPVIALAQELGMSLDEIKSAIRRLDPLASKLFIHTDSAGNTLIDDSYNSNVEGFISAVRKLQSLDVGRRIVISRGIIELGEERMQSYKRISKEIKVDTLLLTTDKLLAEVHPGAVYIRDEKMMSIELQKYIENKYALLVEGRFSPALLNKLGIKRSKGELHE